MRADSERGNLSVGQPAGSEEPRPEQRGPALSDCRVRFHARLRHPAQPRDRRQRRQLPGRHRHQEKVQEGEPDDSASDHELHGLVCPGEDAVEIAFTATETFPTGGQITVLSGVTTAAGGTLTGNAVFSISKGGKSTSPS